MKRANRRREGLGAIELIEQAIHELRGAPRSILASYYLGALPFVLGLLFFWADMSRSAFAEQHLAGAALGIAALFLWLKFWQAIFARGLRASFAGEPLPPLGLRRSGRILMAQTALQPSGLFLLPLALVLLLPFAWTCAFYQNLTALAGADGGEVRPLVKKAARQAALWPIQNHTLLAILLGFGFYVFLDWTSVCFVVPGLLKMLLGLDTIFTRSPLSLLNTTFLAAMLGLTYLCVDPIVKAVYALRCFYGESLQSGEDLKAELRRCVAAGGLPGEESRVADDDRARVSRAECRVTSGDGHWKLPIVNLQLAIGNSQAVVHPSLGTRHSSPKRMPAVPWLLLAGALVFGPALARAAQATEAAAPNPAEAAPPSSLSAPGLDQAIQDVIHQAKYAWRMPREKVRLAEADQPGIIGRFLQRVGTFLRRQMKAFFEWLGKWLRKLSPHPKREAATGYGWIMLLEILLYVLLAAVVAAAAWLVYRLWSDRKRKAAPLAAQAIVPAPDLRDENLGAEQLPEDAWTKLARELLARGELRLAVRAFYFASLAHLAERNLINLAKFKSNRDYERELRRRGHSFPEVLALFAENVLVVDRTWYGMHEVSGDQVSRFATNVERMKAGG